MKGRNKPTTLEFEGGAKAVSVTLSGRWGLMDPREDSWDCSRGLGEVRRNLELFSTK